MGIYDFTNKFWPINRMGNEQSAQNAPKSVEAEKASDRPWDPETAKLTDDDEFQEAITAKELNTQQSPRPSPPSARKVKKANKNKNREARKSSSLEDDVDDIRTVENADEAGVTSSQTNELPSQDEQNDARDTENRASIAKSDKSQPNSRLDTLRYPCPLANKYNCEVTFSTLESAIRHRGKHVPGAALTCPICARTMSRPEKLKKHMERHSEEEIIDASQQDPTVNEDIVDSPSASSIEAHTASVDIESQPEQVGLLPSTQEVPESVMKAANTDRSLGPTNIQHSPTKTLSSLANLFDESHEPRRRNELEQDAATEETPRPKSRLKRKSDGQINQASVGRLQKRRRRNSLSPPASIASEEEQFHGLEKRNSNSASSPKITKAKDRRVGNLDNFAKPWTPGSVLHHPILNPRSPRVSTKQRVEVNIPQTPQAGPSARPTRRPENVLKEVRKSTDELPPHNVKSQKAVYTSPKGKRRAENGVTYSSPPRNSHKDKDSDSDHEEPAGMATSVARRGAAKTVRQPFQRVDAAGSFDDQPVSSGASILEGNGKTSAKCPECGKLFENLRSLNRHLARAGVHARGHKGDDRARKLTSTEKLKAHQQKSGQNDKVTEKQKGAFSAGEVRKLHRWRSLICEENNITIGTFNQMMTDSLRRQKSFQWPYRFITKAEFLQEYYEVLPERDRRSMHRYRERAFQNVPTKQEWTEEDDDELVRLVRELGQKWVEIGQRMTRTQDSVNQRWRFKLQYPGTNNTGDWTQSEVDKLKAAVKEVKKVLNLPLDPQADVQIPWESVSKKMQGIRTPQQCSNKWRLLYQLRMGNIFYKTSEIGSQRSTPSPSLTTPSKMHQRLAGQITSSQKKSTTPKKNFLSAEWVGESDDEDELGNASEKGQDDVSASVSDKHSESHRLPAQENIRAQPSSQQEMGSVPVKTPAVRRTRLPTRTPQNETGLSQAFAQTQANTSALRAPTTSRKAHTQTDMPTPGVPMQHQPASPLWQAINAKVQNTQREEDLVMAEPESSDEELRSIQGEANGASDHTSEATSSDTSESEADGSDDGSDEASNQEVIDATTQNNAFMATIRSPLDRSSASARIDELGNSQQKRIQIDWSKKIRPQSPDVQGETDSGSEDEGDIPFEAVVLNSNA